MRKYLQIEPWGFTLWEETVQVGAGNGVTVEEYLGRCLSPDESWELLWHIETDQGAWITL